LDASKEIGLEVNSEKTKYIFMSCHQTAGQSNYIRVADKSFETSDRVQVFGSNINRPELHSRGNRSRLNLGMLASMQFRIFCLLVSCQEM
jgi:hypothetical protein